MGKLRVPPDLREQVSAAGVRTLGLSSRHGLAVCDLPVHHRDPFDRLIIAQAMTERLTLVTADVRFRAYEIDLVEA